MRSCMHRPDKQTFVGTRADEAVRVKKMHSAQATKPKVHCAGTCLNNVGWFKYLGSIFSADGTQKQDVSRRIAIALSRFGELRQVFNSKDLSENLNLNIYKTTVTSRLTYGCEA